MRYVFFDLGDTLESDDVLRPGAREAVVAIAALRDDLGVSPRLGLISDFHEAETPESIPAIEEDYRRILEDLGIEDLFQPFAQAITLSTQVGVFKPDRRIFRAALDKFDPAAHFHDAIFVTENVAHVAAARGLGMHALHLKGPGQTTADVHSLPELVEPIARLLRFSPCCKKSSEAVGRFKSVASKSSAKDDAIAAAVADVDAARLRTHVDALTAFPTRWSMSPAIAGVSQHVHDAFVAAGYTGANEVRFQKFTMSGAPAQRNVLCGPSAFTRPVILVCAHYDSTSETPSTKAPGGDDNASGVAALVELATLLRGVSLKRDILFAAFGGEEQGLFGSAHCADVAAAEGWPIELVINMDMIGFPNGTPANRIVVEFDQGNRNPQNDASAKAFGLLMAQAATDYTSLAVEHTDIWNSDYMPFEAKGLACIGAYEGGENPFYHRTTDVASSVKVPYLQDVVRMVLATILTIAR
jgi:hypothetical protein